MVHVSPTDGLLNQLSRVATTFNDNDHLGQPPAAAVGPRIGNIVSPSLLGDPPPLMGKRKLMLLSLLHCYHYYVDPRATENLH